MIVGSVLLIAVAAVLLVVGIIRLDGVLLSSAIAVSALAALALLVGTRRQAGIRQSPAEPVVHRSVGRAAPRSIGRASARPAPAPAELGDGGSVPGDSAGVEPSTEPVTDVEHLTEEEATAISALTRTVMVVDGRPRYHLADCPHLLGEAEPLPVLEAVELGFTPCAACRPAAALLAQTAEADLPAGQAAAQVPPASTASGG